MCGVMCYMLHLTSALVLADFLTCACTVRVNWYYTCIYTCTCRFLGNLVDLVSSILPTNMASMNDVKYRFVSPLPIAKCHIDWVGKYNMYLELEEEIFTCFQMLEDLKSQYQRLKWASNSPYIGAMKIRGVLTACR